MLRNTNARTEQQNLNGRFADNWSASTDGGSWPISGGLAVPDRSPLETTAQVVCVGRVAFTCRRVTVVYSTLQANENPTMTYTLWPYYGGKQARALRNFRFRPTPERRRSERVEIRICV